MTFGINDFKQSLRQRAFLTQFGMNVKVEGNISALRESA